MKIFLLFLFLPLGLLSQGVKDPIAYNDKIVGYQNAIGYKMLAMNENIGAEGANLESAEKLRQEVLVTIKESIAGLNKMKAFDGNDDLRLNAINLFQFYESVVKNEYKQAIAIFYDGELTESDIQELETLVNKIAADEVAYDEKFQAAQVAFANKYGIELEENELQEVIDSE